MGVIVVSWQTIMEEALTHLLIIRIDHASRHLPGQRPKRNFGTGIAFAFSKLVYLKCTKSYTTLNAPS